MKARHTIYFVLGAWVAASALTGCARRAPAHPAGPDAHAPATTPGTVAAPADSPLAKITRGMGMKQVQDILGPPTDQMHHITGKQFIPYYFGPDTARIVWYYKGLGRVVFNVGSGFGGGSRVIQTEYDPNEDGYQ